MLFNELARYIIIEGEVLFTIYLWLVALDIFSGVLGGIKHKVLYSKVGLNGMLRHILIFFFTTIATTILYHLNFTMLAHGLQVYIICFYMLSFIENIDTIGDNFLPDWFEEVFLVLKDKQSEQLKNFILPEDVEKYEETEVNEK